MLEALSISLNKAAVLGFVLYILGAAVLFALFQFIYTRITPHKEFELIRSGNVAAAIALGGAMIGFAIPASNVIAYSISILDFVVWAVIAAFVQLLAFLVTSLVLKGASERIKKGEIAAGIYIAAVAISVGMLNAACMTPSPN
jgi:putative membrane protein